MANEIQCTNLISNHSTINLFLSIGKLFDGYHLVHYFCFSSYSEWLYYFQQANGLYKFDDINRLLALSVVLLSSSHKVITVNEKGNVLLHKQLRNWVFRLKRFLKFDLASWWLWSSLRLLCKVWPKKNNRKKINFIDFRSKKRFSTFFLVSIAKPFKMLLESQRWKNSRKFKVSLSLTLTLFLSNSYTLSVFLFISLSVRLLYGTFLLFIQ